MATSVQSHLVENNPTFLFVDNIIGQKQSEYITARNQLNDISDELDTLQNEKNSLLALRTLQFTIEADATNAYNNKKTKETTRSWKKANEALDETEIKIKKIDRQISELENSSLSKQKELEAIATSLKSEQDKKQEQFIHPAWTKDIDEIHKELDDFKEHRHSIEQQLATVSKQHSQSNSQLQKLQEEYTKLKANLSSAQNELVETQTKLLSYQKSMTESIRYWIAIATGGLFKSNRFNSELSIDSLNKKINTLTESSNNKHAVITDLKKTIAKQEGIIQENKELLATDDKVTEKALQMITNLNSSGIKKINSLREQCNNWSLFLNKTPVVYSVKQFIEQPTASNLNKLQEQMKQDVDYLKNTDVKHLITQVGEVYSAVANIHNLCEESANLKQQKIDNGLLLAETEEEKAYDDVINNAQTDLLFLQDQYQQLSSKLLSEENNQLTAEKNDMAESIFLKDALTRKERLAEINIELEQLSLQYDTLLDKIENLDSTEELEEIELIAASSSIDTAFAEKQQLLQKERADIEIKIAAYTGKQIKQIEACRTPVETLELDIAANKRIIDGIEKKIQTIQSGELAALEAIQEKIEITQEIIEHTQQSKQTAITEKNQTLKSIDVTPFLKQTELKSVANACVTFQKSPTNDNLNSLIETIKTDVHNESNPLLLNEIEKIGKMYHAVSIALSKSLQQAPSTEQMNNILISNCEQYIQEHSPTSFTAAATTVFNFLKTNTSKTADSTNETSIIAALKSVLMNDAKAPSSLGIIAKFIQSPDTDKTSQAAQLIIKASEINPQIQLIYTAQKIAQEQTTAFKGRFEEQKRSNSHQSIAESVFEDKSASDLPKL